MEQFLPYLPFVIIALACPIAMGTMMWMMNRPGGHQQMGMGSMPPMTQEQHLASLRAQKEAVEKEIRELETLQALQERRDQLAREIPARQSHGSTR